LNIKLITRDAIKSVSVWTIYSRDG